MNEQRSSTVGQSHHLTSDGTAAAARPGGHNISISHLPSQSPRPRFSVFPRLILWLIVATILLYGVIYPNLHVLVASLQRDGNWSLANYREVLSQSIVLKSIFASVGISALTVLFCSG